MTTSNLTKHYVSPKVRVVVLEMEDKILSGSQTNPETSEDMTEGGFTPSIWEEGQNDWFSGKKDETSIWK